MKYIISVILFTTFFSASAQKFSELGIFVGKGNYNGELNPTQQFSTSSGSLAIGGVYRYNLNPRYALKGSLIFTEIKGNDEIADLEFGRMRKASFESNLLELSGQIEFNFMEYELGERTRAFSPFIFVGLSTFRYNPTTVQDEEEIRASSEEDNSWGIAVPFGIGFKVSLLNRLGLSAEWGFRKTGRDDLDGLPNTNLDRLEFENGKDYDNDWFSIIGVSLNYRLNKKNSCPSNF
tara:strand:+ start:6853 stop:7557 length:705 start_codon:yes stop_codon:yes gene_type:complete